MRIVYLTAGAAGMYCGSCMHDNALAKAMRRLGDDVLLQPIYTPIRTDEVDIASAQVFFGGVHVYLLQQMPWLRFVPRFLRSWLDRPSVIKAATSRTIETDPAKLGALTISMLRGQEGRQADEARRMVDWLEKEIQPDAILLSNLLIGGVIPMIRQRLPKTRIVVLLQGDDIFLDHLPERIRAEAIALCGQLSQHVDTFVTNSRFYRDKMGGLIGIPESKFEIHPLSIDMQPFVAPETSTDAITKQPNEFRVGFFARIAPEKGLHTLVDAFEHLAHDPAHNHITLHVAGWLGKHNEIYLQDLIRRLERAGLSDRFVYHGSPSLEEKVQLMRSFDLLSVPSPYEDPKGLFVLEALASGVPVLQPRHGAFGELIEATGGGECFEPEDARELADRIVFLSQRPDVLAGYVQTANRVLQENHSIESAAARMRATLS